MCNSCNCENYEKCSIVGYMPIGFCCSKCYLYDEKHTCLNTKTKRKSGMSETDKEKLEELRPISTSIEDGVLKVIVGEKEKKKEIYIDLQKHLESQ
jgi:hypothetical protein